jgi:hypothetical protein
VDLALEATAAAMMTLKIIQSSPAMITILLLPNDMTAEKKLSWPDEGDSCLMA